jgi:predicted MPP superfamily phosphohydrolase
MSELYPLIFALFFMIVISLATWLFLRLLNRPWWEHKWIRLTAYLIPIAGIICIFLWASGVKSDSRLVTGIGATGAAVAVVIEIALLLSLPVSGAVHIIIDIIRKLVRRRLPTRKVDEKRRIFLKAAAAAIPVIAISTGVGGVARSFGDIKVPLKTFSFPDLPDKLNGLKILQISDVHLGYYIILDDLVSVLTEAEQYNPDMVLVTGDLADDLRLLPEALELISQLKPHYGSYACLGNHEYYRGIAEVQKAYDKSRIPLLVNSGVPIGIEGVSLYIAGADDPRWMRRDNSGFLRNTIEQSTAEAPDKAFVVLMSHRPEGFDPAAEQGVHLTLSGHTHGGQIGLAGRSFFDLVTNYKYLWGHYQKPNGSQLYTTSGIGHWFPFRLGCPQEAPLIKLEKG